MFSLFVFIGLMISSLAVSDLSEYVNETESHEEKKCTIAEHGSATSTSKGRQ